MDNKLRLIVSLMGNDKLSGSLKGIVGLAQSGSQRLAAMKREARDLDRELREVQAEQGRALGNVTHLFDKEAALKAQIARTNGEMAEQVRLLEIGNKVSKMRARGDALKSAGQSNVVQGAGILGGLGIAATGAASFQSGMTDIALKAGLSREDTAGLQRNILAAARAAKQLPENLRAGVDTLAGFGMSPQEATQMIAPIGKVATAYRAQVDDLAAASYANFSNLKVPVNETAKALEVMAAAGNAGAFEIKDMAQYFPGLTAQAQAFGQHGVTAVADLAAAAQIARKGTGDSASAAANLNNLLAKINTEETIKKFAKMGVDLPAALKKAYAEGKTPLEAIATITDKTLSGKLDKLSFLFGDMQAQSALRPLIQNMEEYRKIRAEALASKDAVDAAFARRSEDAATQATALVGNLQRLAITAGPVLLPPLVKITGMLITLTDRVAGWAEANPQAAGALVGLVAGIGAFKLGLGALQIVFGSILGPMGTAFGFIMRNGPLLFRMFSIMRMGALFLARGVVRAGLMMLANPLVAAIVAIVAVLGFAGYMIYTHWDKIKAAFATGIAAVQGAWAGFKDWMWGGLTWFVGLHVQFAQAGAQIMQGLWNGITSRISAIKSLITGIAGKVVGWFKGILGIHSPSRVFMGLGGHIVGGLALGIDRNAPAANGAVQRLAQGIGRQGFALADLAPLGGSRGGASGGGSSGGGAMAAAAPINIHIYAAPGQSEKSIGLEVERALARHFDAQAARGRRAFADD